MDFPIGEGSTPVQPCKCPVQKNKPSDRAVPARSGGPGQGAFSFCVAPSNPSRPSHQGLALAWPPYNVHAKVGHGKHLLGPEMASRFCPGQHFWLAGR
jgi:hypothetical protein